ncbi:MAG: helix-turn-helix transcriptional regulator [Ruminococcus sp.]|nr:helix-turn-helix transcriptional regulator [Ruminococcus sp.]
MESLYIDTAKVLKSISDPKRLQIVDMLSCGELCACHILEEFHITQPTLSHDMKVLVDAGIVNFRRDGKNIFYSLNKDKLQSFIGVLEKIFNNKPDCICNRKTNKGC